MDRDYLQEALMSFNIDTPNWYGWKKEDDNGNKIPNDQRMQYQHIKIIKDAEVTEIRTYRQTLRDFPSAVTGNPATTSDVTWPTPPSCLG